MGRRARRGRLIPLSIRAREGREFRIYERGVVNVAPGEWDGDLRHFDGPGELSTGETDR